MGSGIEYIKNEKVFQTYPRIILFSFSDTRHLPMTKPSIPSNLVFGALAFWAVVVFVVYFSRIPDPAQLLSSAWHAEGPQSWVLGGFLAAWFRFAGLFFQSLLLVFALGRIGVRFEKLFTPSLGNPLLRLSFQFALGALFTTLLWAALGINGLWQGPFLLALLLGIILWALWDGAQALRKGSFLFPSLPLPGGLYRGLALLIGFELFFCFLHDLAPETWVDSLVYHLGFLKNDLARHTLVDMPTHSYSLFPFAGELYFLNGLLLGGTEVAKLLNGWVFFFTVLFAGGWALEWAGEKAAWIAMALTASFPLLCMNAWTTQVETILTLFVLIFIYFVARLLTQEGNSPANALAAGLGLGMILSIKYTGLVIPLAVLPAALWQSFDKNTRPFSGRFVALLFLAAAIVFFFWPLRALVLTGDPVYPFGPSGASFRVIPEAHLKNLIAFSHNLPRAFDLTWWNFPWALTMNAVSIYDFLGPFYLLALPLFFLARPQKPGLRFLWKVLLLYALAAPWVSEMPRFHIPWFILAGLSLAVWVGSRGNNLWEKGFAWAALVSALLTLPYLFGMSGHYFSCGGLWQGRENPADYLERKLTGSNYACCDWIAHNTPPGSGVLLVGEAQGYYLDRSFDANMLPDVAIFQHIVRRAQTARDIQEQVRQLGVDYILVGEPKGIQEQGWLPPGEEWTQVESALLDQYQKVYLTPVYQADRHRVYQVRSGS